MSDTMLIDLDVDINAIDEEIEQELQANFTLAVQTEILKKAAGKVERSIAKKAVQEIYLMIYMEVQEDKIIFRGINNDYMTEAVVRQNPDKTNFQIRAGRPGAICFPGDKFIQIVKKLSHKNTEIKMTNKVATIKSGRSKFELHAVGGEEFPRTPDLDGGVKLDMHPQVLSMMYDRTMYAVSTKETRPVLTGVHHHLLGTQLKCVATDAHRLSQFVYEVEETLPEVSCTVPATVLSEAKKHLDAAETEVSVYFYENQIVYDIDNVKVYARVLEGTYPNTDALIFGNDQAATQVVVNAGMFKNLLEGSTVYNPNQPIIIRIKTEDNQLRVNTREAEVGAFEADLAINSGSGNDIITGVNVRYLQDALSRYSSDDNLLFSFLPARPDKPIGMQPFKANLHNGREDCLELFVPVRSAQIDYNAPVEIENFKGVSDLEFNPFESDFDELD